jgi:uncharacterized protein YoaH (UPF0181 family)
MASAGLVVAGTVSTGSLAALVAKVLRRKKRAKDNSKSKEQGR